MAAGPLLVLGACAAHDPVRAVVALAPESVQYTRVSAVDASSPAPMRFAVLPDEVLSALSATLLDLDAGGVLGAGPVQLDADAGPVDLGYPLLVDLGAGDAPYDDGVLPLAADGVKRGGFSDSVIRVTWRERFAPSASLTGGAAFLRHQDIGILDGLPEARFGFLVLGVEITL